MPTDPASDIFPCPFCGSKVLLLIGRAQRFAHLRCAECSEVWTATAAARNAEMRVFAAVLEEARRGTRH